MTVNEQVAAKAREWIGVPFLWQGSSRAGCDCKGLVKGVAEELGLPEAQTFYANVSDYSPQAPLPHKLIREGMAAVFKQADEAIPGDVLLLRHGGRPGHFAICLGDTAVHARVKYGSVRETKLRVLFHDNRLDSIWRWHG